jgi:hypothetical protein
MTCLNPENYRGFSSSGQQQDKALKGTHAITGMGGGLITGSSSSKEEEATFSLPSTARSTRTIPTNRKVLKKNNEGEVLCIPNGTREQSPAAAKAARAAATNGGFLE